MFLGCNIFCFLILSTLSNDDDDNDDDNDDDDEDNDESAQCRD